MTDYTETPQFQQDISEALAEAEQVIAVQKERIAELEMHLGRLRDVMWQGYYATAGVLPFNPEAEPMLKRPSKRGRRHD